MDNLFFDLDGTLIDSKKRLYNLFCELCPENQITYTEYWKIKRDGITQKEILKNFLHYEDKEIKRFQNKYLKLIEEEDRLKQDEKIDNIDRILDRFLKKYNLYVVTNRQSSGLTKKELESFNLDKYFRKILVTKQKINKSDLIQNKLRVSKNDIFIGDTVEDILTAQILGIKSIAVTWGNLNRSVLEKHKPNTIIDNSSELENLL